MAFLESSRFLARGLQLITELRIGHMSRARRLLGTACTPAFRDAKKKRESSLTLH